MHSHGPKEPPNVEMGFEEKDLNLPVIVKSTILFFLFIGFSGMMGYGVYAVLNGTGSKSDKKLSRVMPSAETPLLQTNTTTFSDIRDFRQEEDAKLTQPGWINQNKGTVRIPIERAIELTAQRGLPPTPPTHVAGTIKPREVVRR